MVKTSTGRFYSEFVYHKLAVAQVSKTFEALESKVLLQLCHIKGHIGLYLSLISHEKSLRSLLLYLFNSDVSNVHDLIIK